MMNELAARILSLQARLEELTRNRSAEVGTCFDAGNEAQQDFQRLKESLEKDLLARKAALEAQLQRDRQLLAQRFTRRLARADNAFRNCRTRGAQTRKQEMDKVEDEQRQEKEKLQLADQERAQQMTAQLEETKARVQELRLRDDLLRSRLTRLARSYGLDPASLSPLKPAEPAAPAPARLDLEGFKKKQDEVGCILITVEEGFWPALTRRLFIGLAYVALLGGLAAIFFLLLKGRFEGRQLLYLLGGGVAGVIGINLASLAGSRSASQVLTQAQDRISALVADLANHERWAEEDHERQTTARMDSYMARIANLEEEFGRRLAERSKAAGEALIELKDRHEALKERIKESRNRAVRELEERSQQTLARMSEAVAGQLRERQAACQERFEAAERRKLQAAREFTTRWMEAWGEFTAQSTQELTLLRTRHPHFEEAAQPQWPLPKAFPEEVLVGTATLAAARLPGVPEPRDEAWTANASQACFPIALRFPHRGNLLVQAYGNERAQALDILFATVLRTFAAFPPGQAKFTIFDPLGRGQGFAALMPVADHDESLLGGRIWTEPSHLEKRLADLTEHVEKVIQKYLRNRYESIGAYNRDAGEMKEPFHFLVLADFPSGFSDLAIDRLASLISSGPPCGVHILLFHDAREKLPAKFDLALLKNSGLVLTGHPEGFRIEGEAYRQTIFQAEAKPAQNVLEAFLARIGQGAVASHRVEVPFSAVTPKPAEVWSQSGASGIRVPIGRTGAERLQYFDVGKGTAQHALLAGRTGSGKSTLFHVLITNLSLWYSPHDVGFYLIDFKKGVEFKAYASARLPHARVIAIESDREFGLSVLRSLDQELNRRGELFRDAGVQDLASFQRRGGERLPRLLLMIDEFQEFFTEDDGIGRDASLLLDRFVRQGRAFGIHVILGSQTLSGVYSLAKSTLGQIGVRIALQCNEADSSLILSEENTAARLLTRPGEAIYNGMSGLLEGNSPFQIVWLDEEAQTARLAPLPERAEAEGWRPASPAVVFEGNRPARITENTLLLTALEPSEEAPAAAGTVWLGEPNAIKGPTEVRFSAETGRNLLLIGQRPDASTAIGCACLLGLAATHAPEELRLLVIGGGPDPETQHGLELLRDNLPHGIEFVGLPEIPKRMAQLAESCSGGEEGGQPATRRKTFLFIPGLHRFRSLRQEDEFSLTLNKEAEPAAGESLAKILREGPTFGIHCLIWCDSLSSLNRALSRGVVKEFDLRVLFQMSSSDSTELIDSPAANLLGMHNALLYAEQTGLIEKFRPYAIPPEEFLAKAGQALRTKFTCTAS